MKGRQLDAVPQTVLGVWAHPDDEAYLAAGLVIRCRAAGGRVVCLHATRGERGTDDPWQWPAERLGALREAELADALDVLGVEEHTLLGLPDGGCAAVDPSRPVTVVADLIEATAPDLVVTFGPDGITGHPDHVAVSRWVTAAWCQVRQGELLYAASTHSFIERHRALHRRIGIQHDGAAIDDDEVALRIELTPAELDRKRRCLAAHASQTTPLATAMGEDQYRNWYRTETFRRPDDADLAAACAVLSET
jgi:LmbE family N-acetylglucosaminyl deacetylase